MPPATARITAASGTSRTPTSWCPGPHRAIRASDDDGVVDPVAVDLYRRADRLDPFGFSGWIGREPHGVHKSNTGTVRDGVFADQVVGLFDELARTRDEGPWLAVASFVNPHDIAFSGFGWDHLLGFDPPDDTVPEVPEAPSQSDSFDGRPAAQRAFFEVWPQLLYDQPGDLAYRRLYYYLHKLVDAAIMRILDALEASGFEDDTIVVFTSDHGDLLGAHGGLLQKWHNAFDECTRVPDARRRSGRRRRRPPGVRVAHQPRRRRADVARAGGCRRRSRSGVARGRPRGDPGPARARPRAAARAGRRSTATSTRPSTS